MYYLGGQYASVIPLVHQQKQRVAVKPLPLLSLAMVRVLLPLSNLIRIKENNASVERRRRLQAMHNINEIFC